MTDPLEPARRLVLPAFALALALGGCSGTAGSEGDSPSDPRPNPYGTGSRVSEVLGPATWHRPDDQFSENCTGIPLDREVAFSGLSVVGVDRFDETSEGALGNVYAEDTMPAGVVAPPYSGITVYAPGFTPPDLRVVENDVMDVFGNLTEFVGPSSGNFPYCRTLPEVGGSMTFRFDRGGVAPVVIPVTDLASYDGARQWLGMLVTVVDVRAADAPDEDDGRYTIPLNVGAVVQADQPSISNELFDLGSHLAGAQVVVEAGTTFSSITGIVTYFYAVHIAPRSAADVVP